MKTPKAAKAPAAPPTIGHRMDVASARRIAAASRASGFPVPPHVQAVLDAAGAPPVTPPPAEVDSSAASEDTTKDPT